MSDSSESIVRAERVKDGRDISIVKESTVVVTPRRLSDEEVTAGAGVGLGHVRGGDSLSQRAGVGYAVTCNHNRMESPRNGRRDSGQWDDGEFFAAR